MAKRPDESAIEETSLILLEQRAVMVGMKARIEAPEDQRAEESLGTLFIMQRSVL